MISKQHSRAGRHLPPAARPAAPLDSRSTTSAAGEANDWLCCPAPPMSGPYDLKACKSAGICQLRERLERKACDSAGFSHSGSYLPCFLLQFLHICRNSRIWQSLRPKKLYFCRYLLAFYPTALCTSQVRCYAIRIPHGVRRAGAFTPIMPPHQRAMSDVLVHRAAKATRAWHSLR